MSGVRFDQLRISTTLANAGLESYSDGTLGPSSIRIAAGDGVALGTGGVYVDGTENYMKEPVRVRSSSNVNISAPGTTIDGVTLSVGDRVLLDNQGTTSQDGIWVFQGSAVAMTRSEDAPVGADAAGWYIQALEGANENLYRVDANLGAAIIGTNDISTSVFSGGASRTAGNGLVDGTGDDLDVNTGDGITVSSDRVVAQVSTATGAQQYGGLVRNRSADGSTGGTANAGYLAVQTDNSTLAVNASNQVGIPAGGVTGTQLNSSVAGNGLAGGGGSALSLDLSELSAAVFDPAADSLPFLDATDSGSKSDAWADIAALIAGDGLGATSGVLAVNTGTGITTSTDSVVIDTNSTVDFSSSTPVWTFGNETTAEGLFVTGTPVDDTHVTNKAYVDSVASGLDVKESVNTATTGLLTAESSVNTATYSATGGTSTRGQITGTLAASDTFTLDGVTYSSAEDGSRVLIKDESSGTAQVHSVDTVADVTDSLDGTFFVFYTTPNQAFYVWYDTPAGSGDPTPTPPAGVTYTGIQVTIIQNEAANDVASKTKTQIDGTDFSGKGGSPTVGVSTNQMTITNAEGGLVTNVADGSAATGFTFGTDTPGTGLGGAANGIYTTTVSGTSLTLDRASDFDSDTEVTAGAFTFIEEGTSNADSGWVLTTNDPITIGGAAGTPLAFTQFSGAGAITAGDGLTQSGSTINLGNNGTGTFSGLAIGADSVAVSLAASAGLKFSSNQIAIEPADFAGTGLEDDGSDNLRLAAQGNGIAGGAGSTLSVQADITTAATGTANAISVGANGVAISVDNATLEGSLQGVAGAETLRVKDSGIVTAKIADLNVTTGKLAANAATIAKLDIEFLEEEYAASTFTNVNPSTHDLVGVAILGTQADYFAECYRNGVADMTNVGNGGTPSSSTQFKIDNTGAGSLGRITIGANIFGSGDTYRIKYLSPVTS